MCFPINKTVLTQGARSWHVYYIVCSLQIYEFSTGVAQSVCLTINLCQTLNQNQINGPFQWQYVNLVLSFKQAEQCLSLTSIHGNYSSELHGNRPSRQPLDQYQTKISLTLRKFSNKVYILLGIVFSLHTVNLIKEQARTARSLERQEKTRQRELVAIGARERN